MRRMVSKSPRQFNAQAFLESAGIAPKGVAYARGAAIFSQGDECTASLHPERQRQALRALATGREASSRSLDRGILRRGLPGRPTESNGRRDGGDPEQDPRGEKRRMLRLLHHSRAGDRFITHMLGTNIRIEEDLLDQLFNHHEKRLARALLLLARYGMKDEPKRLLPKISRHKLAKLAGITSSNVDFFMRKFERLGFIADNGGLTINNSLLSVVLHE